MILKFGRYRGWALSDLPISYIYWLRGVGVAEPLYCALGCEIERREKRKRRRAA